MEKSDKCGTVAKDTVERVLSRWLRAGNLRKVELNASEWVIRGNATSGYASKRVDSVYLAAERARNGAVQCIGRRCNEFYVPPVPHSTEPQWLVCTAPKCGASFCSACRQVHL